jgi:ubiquinone/menaquinone biosynthesis C-methylase UbiE
MGRLAGRNLRRAGYVPSDLVRGLAQALPFASSSIDTVVSTFPSEYIFDAMTLAEVRRVLVSGGRLVTLPVAWPSNQLLSLLFKVTGEAPSEAMDQVKARASQPFLDAGYLVEILELNVKSGRLMIILATPKGIDR